MLQAQSTAPTSLRYILRTLRLQSDITLSDMANRLGISTGLLSHIECGRRKLTTDLFHILSYEYPEHKSLIDQIADLLEAERTQVYIKDIESIRPANKNRVFTLVGAHFEERQNVSYDSGSADEITKVNGLPRHYNKVVSSDGPGRYRCAPRDRFEIHEIAQSARQRILHYYPRSFQNNKIFNIKGLLSYVLEMFDTNLIVIKESERSLINFAECMTCTVTNSLYVTDRTLNLIEKGGSPKQVARLRSTLAHELGHILMHTNGELHLVDNTDHVRPFEDPEWQAWEFAQEFLLPRLDHVTMKGHPGLAELYGVTQSFVDTCARKRLLCH